MVNKITGKRFRSASKERIFWWGHGWARLLDGLVEALLLGFVFSDLAGIALDYHITRKLSPKPRFGTNTSCLGDFPLLVERSYWWLHAWTKVADGLIQILSLGFFIGYLGDNLSSWRIRRWTGMNTPATPTPAPTPTPASQGSRQSIR